MGCEIKYIGTTESTNISYVSVQLICATTTTSYNQKTVQKISILEKAFLPSSCSALVVKKFKKYLWRNSILVKLWSYILQLHQTMNCFTVIFSKFLITVAEWYIIMVQWPCLKVSKIVWEEWQEYIKRGIPKRGSKIWRGWYQSNPYNLLHMLSFCLYI